MCALSFATSGSAEAWITGIGWTGGIKKRFRRRTRRCLIVVYSSHGVSVKNKQERIVEARMKLRRRFLDRMNHSPSIADEDPMGSGDRNRHGMPRLPPEQSETTKWPVLDLGIHPTVELHDWSLVVDGACDKPLTLSWEDFQNLDQTEDISDFHCVTKWSQFDMSWKGVRFSDLAGMASVHENADFVFFYGYDDYTTNLPLAEALKDDVLLVHEVNGGPLPKEHGGPVRMITPQLYAWKGTKWIKRIEFLTADRLGFWEERGYSNTAYPWRNDRYS